VATPIKVMGMPAERGMMGKARRELSWPGRHAGQVSLSGRFWARVGVATLLALAVVVVVPHLAGPGRSSGALAKGAPPVGVLLASSVLVGLVTTGALYLAVRRDLKLPVTVALYAVAYETLVVAVKFGLGPFGLYEVNRRVAITLLSGSGVGAGGASLIAIAVFSLYFIVYGLLYLWARESVRHRQTRLHTFPKKRPVVFTFLVLVPVLLLGAGGWVAAVLLLSLPIQYLDLVFSSGVAGFTALALGGAAVLAGMAFRSTADQVRVLGTANLLINVFFVGLVFLVVLHVLWVVYIAVVTSLWPLNTVVPK